MHGIVGELHGHVHGMVTAWTQHGQSMSKACAWHGRGTAWARHGHSCTQHGHGMDTAWAWHEEGYVHGMVGERH